MKVQMSDSEKISLLYTLYEQEMFRICFAILNDRYAAEDAVSESFLKLIRTRDRISDPRSDACKLFTLKTAKNTAIDMYRRNERERGFCEVLSEYADNTLVGCSSGDGGELVAVREIVNKLPKKYRDVIECICFKGLTAHEASAVLRISEECVRKRLERARRKLQSLKR